MKEIEANKEAWNLLAKDHYENYKKKLASENSLISSIITEELGDINGKKIIHLQCNTGADTISLARMGATVTGVDLAPDNIIYANQLAMDFNISNVNFIESDIMELKNIHHEKYDIVFTTEGSIGWMSDLNKWALTVRHLLKDDGFLYIYDAHPYFLALDEDELRNNNLIIKYPYFDNNPDVSTSIGGYASKPVEAISYFWMHSVSKIINTICNVGLSIEFFNEFDKLCWDNGGMEQVEKGEYQYPFFKDKLPFSFSLKASVRK